MKDVKHSPLKEKIYPELPVEQKEKGKIKAIFKKIGRQNFTADPKRAIPKQEWNKAINYVKHRILKEKETNGKALFFWIKLTIGQEGLDGLTDYHIGLGAYVRNLLRDGGFQWGAVCLDHTWQYILEDVVRDDRFDFYQKGARI